MSKSKTKSSTINWQLKEIFKIILNVEAEKNDSLDAIARVELILANKILQNEDYK